MQIFVNNVQNWWSPDTRLTWNFTDCLVALRFVFLIQQQWLNCFDVIISTCTASAAARTPVDCSDLLPAACWCCSSSNLCSETVINCQACDLYILADFWLKFCLLYSSASKLPCLLDTVSKFALFTVSNWKDEKFIKQQTYMKTETCKLYCRDFWIFLPKTIKIDLYNFKLYRLKVGPFLRQCIYFSELYLCISIWCQLNMLLLAIAMLLKYHLLSYCPFHWKCGRLLFWTFIFLVLVKALFSVVYFSSFIRGSPISRSRSLRGLSLVSFSASYVSFTTLFLYVMQVDTRKNIYLSCNTATQLILQTADIIVSACTDSIPAP